MRHPRMGHALLRDIRMGDLVAPLMARSRSNGAGAGAAADGIRRPGRQVGNYPPCSPVPEGCSLLEPSHHWRWKRFICRISKPCESMMFSDMRRSSAWMPDSQLGPRHPDRALVVGDHHLHEGAVEVRHVSKLGRVVVHPLLGLAQPEVALLDAGLLKHVAHGPQRGQLGALELNDPLRKALEPAVLCPREGQVRRIHRGLVVRDHRVHERRVGAVRAHVAGAALVVVPPAAARGQRNHGERRDERCAQCGRRPHRAAG